MTYGTIIKKMHGIKFYSETFEGNVTIDAKNVIIDCEDGRIMGIEKMDIDDLYPEFLNR